MDTKSDHFEIQLHSEADFEESTDSHVRQPDGAVHWPTLMQTTLHAYEHKTRSWNFYNWLHALSAASDKVGFEY